MKAFSKSGVCLRVCSQSNGVAIDDVKAQGIGIPSYTLRIKMDDPTDRNLMVFFSDALDGGPMPRLFWGVGQANAVGGSTRFFDYPSTGTYNLYIRHPFRIQAKEETFEWLDVRSRYVDMPDRGDTILGFAPGHYDLALSAYDSNSGKPYNWDQDFSLEEMWRDTEDLADIPDWDWINMPGVINMTKAFSNPLATAAYFTGTNFLNFPFPANATVRELLRATELNVDLGGWDVSVLKDFTEMFYDDNLGQFRNLGKFNNGGVSGLGVGLDRWDTSSATTMVKMFQGNGAFNCRLDSWDVSNVTDMANIFARCSAFNNGGVSGPGLGIDNWNVGLVENFSNAFARVGDNTPTIPSFYLGSWNTSSATDMAGMFASGAVNPTGLNNWDVSNVETMASMFGFNGGFNQPLSNWNTGSCRNMFNMFGLSLSGIPPGGGPSPETLKFNQDIGDWDVSLVEDFRFMFSSNPNFNNGGVGGVNLGLDKWNTGSATSMERMFGSFSGSPNTVFNHPLGSWDVSNVVNMQAMFSNNSAFDQDLSSWNLSSLQFAQGMFHDAPISDANIENCLVGWNNNPNTNTGVSASGMFGNRSISESSFPNAKAAYDNLAAPVSSGGKGWDLTNAITWVA